MITGDRMPKIALSVVTIPNCQGLIPSFFSPCCEAVDAFSKARGYDNNWLCPRVCQIVRVLKHMEVCIARGTLILPLWKSSFFWNVLQQMVRTGADSLLTGSTYPSPTAYLSKGKPVIIVLAPDPLIFMLLFCESAFAISGPIYVERGFTKFYLSKVSLL